MLKANVPNNESDRLSTLEEYGVLDTESEKIFDDLTLLASQICETPISLISLVDVNRQWFKSKVGLDANETHRDIAFCSHAILQDDIFEIQNALKDDRFFDNPLVTNSPNIRFYAGVPLKSVKGHNIGTLCVISDKPKKLTEIQRNTLEILGREVIAHFELNIKNNRLNKLLVQVNEQKHKLLAAKKDAEEASLAKSKFLANMSHEIRTPLHGILNLAELGLEDTSIGDKDNSLEGIKNSANILSNIVNDILDFSKIEAGKLEIETIKFEIKKVVNSVFDGLKLSANKKGILFEIIIDDKLEELLLGDPVRIYQIVNNLCSNAIKFTEKGKVTLQVTVVEESKSLDKVNGSQLIKFSVIDTGVGIAKEKISKLFQAFNQADLSTARKYGGTGLGLSICTFLSDLMAGSLSFSSELGFGSTFSYQQLFPISSLSKKELTSNEVVNLQQAKILVAEDNRINQSIVSRILSRHNAQVIMTENGQACVEQFIAHGADLILMDIQMPIMDGIEATNKIRSLESGKDIPIIAMTANTLNSDVDEYLNIGMNGYLGKPFDQDNFNALLNIYNPKTFEPRISQLAREIGNPSLSINEKLLSICQQAKVLIPNTNRVSLWVFEQDFQEIHCLYGVDHDESDFKDLRLSANDFPAYFDFIIQNQVLDASDARANDSTKCFNESYFKPLNIYSLLDYIFFIEGKPAGVICCERVGSACDWKAHDAEELIKIANITTLFFAKTILNQH